MLEVIEKKSELEKVQNLLEDRMHRDDMTQGSILVGYQGGNEEIEASWSEELGIWWGFGEAHNRYWNAFGTEEPDWNSVYSHIITCEINPPFEGIDRRMSGVFAKDSAGSYYIMHRGKIGGGRKGIGKAGFEQRFRGERFDVKDGDRISRLALVASLDSPRLARQVADFVHEVDRIKDMSVEGVAADPLQDTGFAEEFSGTRTVRVKSEEIEAECNHGIVVNELARQLERRGMRIGNNQYIDLFVLDDNNNLKIAFEVKTSASSTQYYEAIGQLLFHSAELAMKPQFVAVFPQEIDRRSRRIFGELGIDCLTYKWDGDEPVFNRLSRLTE